jgi:hypothetical protein
MFFITAIYSEYVIEPDIYGSPYSRCFGYFIKKEDAIKAVENNESDLHECLYDYIVIENLKEGLYCGMEFNPSEIWFQWNGTEWLECIKPDFAKNIVNWAIG